MASNGLPLMQMPFITVPAQCSPKNMAFCSAVSRRSYFGNLVSSVLPTPANGAYSSSERSSRGFYSIRAEVAADSVVETKQSEEENVSPSDSDEAAGVLTAEEKPPRRPRIKLGDIMGILNRRAVEASDENRPIPDLRTGDIVEIKLEVPENKKRLSVYKGIVISRQNSGIHTTIRIRRVIAGVGVEIVFPIYSPNIKEIKVVKRRKVRRARLYYLRDKLPRLSTFK